MEDKKEDGHSLLATLLELSEWTEKRKNELEAMAPLGGDEATLQHQQERQEFLTVAQHIDLEVSFESDQAYVPRKRICGQKYIKNFMFPYQYFLLFRMIE